MLGLGSSATAVVVPVAFDEGEYAIEVDLGLGWFCKNALHDMILISMIP